MDLRKLCRDLYIEYESYKPRETVNRVIRSLSDSSDQNVTTLLLMDEVRPCSYDQPLLDWRYLSVRENVVWLLGLSPRAFSGSASTKVLPPETRSVLTRHLVHKHRNCPQIRNVVKTIRISYYSYYAQIYNSGLICRQCQDILRVFHPTSLQRQISLDG